MNALPISLYRRREDRLRILETVDVDANAAEAIMPSSPQGDQSNEMHPSPREDLPDATEERPPPEDRQNDDELPDLTPPLTRVAFIDDLENITR
jgi:hypothetical protein